MQSDASPAPLLLDAADVASLLKVSREVIRNLHRSGQLPAVRVGRHNRWRPADVERFVQGLQPQN